MNLEDIPKFDKFDQDYSQDPEKPKICCACPETRKYRDECILYHGTEKCKDIIDAHKRCMRQYGYDI